jgi:hypothetical protein
VGAVAHLPRGALCVCEGAALFFSRARRLPTSRSLPTPHTSHPSQKTKTKPQPSLVQSFSWGAYEYLWYAASTGSWGFKTPATAITMFDNWGNSLAVKVRTSINLQTWEVVSVRVEDYRFNGNNWGK